MLKLKSRDTEIFHHINTSAFEQLYKLDVVNAFFLSTYLFTF